MKEEVSPAWMTDGKGLRGDVIARAAGRIAFPSAKITHIEPQLPLSQEPAQQAASRLYPWIAPAQNPDEDAAPSYDVMIGDDEASLPFGAIKDGPAAIRQFKLYVEDPDDASNQSMDVEISPDNSYVKFFNKSLQNEVDIDTASSALSGQDAKFTMAKAKDPDTGGDVTIVFLGCILPAESVSR